MLQAKPAKGPMRPELDVVRVKPGLGLKQQPKQRQGLLTNIHVQEEGACGGGGAGDDRSELGR